MNIEQTFTGHHGIGAVPAETELTSPGYILDNRFKLVALLGNGGMGQVFEAEHLNLQEPMALKILYGFYNKNDIAVSRFLAEAQIQAKLKHPNIVQVKDAGVSSRGHRFIAMELLSGEPLSEWMGQTPLENKSETYILELVGYLIGVCHGLKAAHDQQIVHRDLKPSNIFLHADDERESPRIVPKILDFGVAKRIDTTDIKLTAPDGLCGTVEYISPEGIRGEDPDVRSDTYSLGVILYEALTGSTPFHADEPNAVLAKVVDRDFHPQAAHKLNPHVSAKLNRLCMRALERDPKKRFQTALDFSHALAECCQLTDTGAPLGTTSSIYPINPQYRRSIGLAVISGVAVLIVAVLLWPGFRKNLGSFTDEPPARRDRPAGPESPARRDSVPSASPGETAESNQAIAVAQPIRSVVERPQSGSPVTAIPSSKPAANGKREKAPLNAEGEVEHSARRSVAEHKAHDTGDERREKVRRLLAEGNTALKHTELKKAALAFDRVLYLEPGNAVALYGSASVDFQSGRYPEAVDKIQSALNRAPHRHKWRNKLGIVLARIGKTQSARTQWELVLARDPGNAEAKRLLAKNQ